MVALVVVIFILMLIAVNLYMAMLALRAVLRAGRVSGGNSLFANGALQAIVGIWSMRFSCSDVAVFANRAVGFKRFVLYAGVCTAVLAFRAINAAVTVRSNCSGVMAYVAFGIARVVVGMRTAFNGSVAVTAGHTIAVLCYVTEASANKIATSASHAVGRVLKIVWQFSFCASVFFTQGTLCGTVVFIFVGKLRVRYGFFLALSTANGASLLLNLISLATWRSLGFPFVRVRNRSSEVTSLTVTLGVAGVRPLVVKGRTSCDCLGSLCAHGANLVQIFRLGAGCGGEGYIIAVAMLPSFNGISADSTLRAILFVRSVAGAISAVMAEVAFKVFNSIVLVRCFANEITSRYVTKNGTSVIKCVPLWANVARSRFLVLANFAQAMLNFGGGAGGIYFRFPFAKGMSDFSYVAALGTVAGDIAVVGEVVAERSANLLCFFSHTNGAASGKNFRSVAGCSCFRRPRAKGVRVLARVAADVTGRIATIVVNVVGNRSLRTAEVAGGIASVVINMRLCASNAAANVAVVITNSGINVVGNRSQRTANVAGSIASVGINV